MIAEVTLGRVWVKVGVGRRQVLEVAPDQALVESLLVWLLLRLRLEEQAGLLPLLVLPLWE